MEVDGGTPVARLLACMQANAETVLQVSDLRLEYRAEDEIRSFSARFASDSAGRDFRAVLELTAPADVAGTRYLLLAGADEDAIHVHLPAIGKPRRVLGIDGDDRIAGTSLAVGDLRLMAQALAASAITREQVLETATGPQHVLRFTALAGTGAFERARVTVDEDSCVVLRAEFERDGTVVRRYVADPSSLMRLGGHHYASVSRIENLMDGSQVRLRLRGVSTGGRLPARWFDPRRFHLR